MKKLEDVDPSMVIFALATRPLLETRLCVSADVCVMYFAFFFFWKEILKDFSGIYRRLLR